MSRLTPAQRRLLEAVRDGARLVYRSGSWFLTGKTRECKHIRSDTPTALERRGLIRYREPGGPYEFTVRYTLTQAGLAALEDGR